MAVDFSSTSEALVVQSPSQLTIGRIGNNILRPVGNPTFHAYKSNGGASSGSAIIFNVVNFNVGNGYNASTGIFTDVSVFKLFKFILTINKLFIICIFW